MRRTGGTSRRVRRPLSRPRGRVDRLGVLGVVFDVGDGAAPFPVLEALSVADHLDLLEQTAVPITGHDIVLGVIEPDITISQRDGYAELDTELPVQSGCRCG